MLKDTRTVGPERREAERFVVDHVFGMRRGGQHAVMNWLQNCYQAAGMTIFHANSVFNNVHLGMEPHWPDPDPQSVWKESAGYNVLMASYEDVSYTDRNLSPIYRSLRATGTRVRDTVIARDWYNFAASRLMYIDEARQSDRRTLMRALPWEEVTRRWLANAHIVKESESASGSSLVGVNYDRWFMDESYRNLLATQYGLPNSDAGKDQILYYGSGSSFDGMSQDGSASSMNVLRRWQDLPSFILPEYRAIISQPGLGQINEELFGMSQSAILDDVSSRMR